MKIMVSTIDEVIAFIAGLLVIVVYMYLGPGMGQEISTAMPINESGDFAGAKTGGDIWTSNTSLVGVVLLMVLIGLAVRSLKNLKGKSN